MSFWGKKRFINTTPLTMSVELWVRNGETPGQTKSIKEFALVPGQNIMEDYGDDENPFLDGISINAVFQGQMIGEQQFAFNRGCPLDRGFNTNDTITVGMEGMDFVLDFSNTWTV